MMMKKKIIFDSVISTFFALYYLHLKNSKKRKSLFQNFRFLFALKPNA